MQDVIVFHAGTAMKHGDFVTNGGRVLFVACKANSLQEAKDKVYKEIGKIESDGLFYRSDIGYRAIGHEMTRNYYKNPADSSAGFLCIFILLISLLLCHFSK